ncbi:MAG: DUF4190 domain-containing protein [Micromonosporaceae bacterium]
MSQPYPPDQDGTQPPLPGQYPPPAQYAPPAPYGSPAPYPAPPGYYPTQPFPPAAPKPGVNGFAVAALVLGICGGPLLSVIFGIIALRQIRRTGQQGRGMAIAGLVLSAVWVLAIAIGVAVALATGTTRDSTGQLTGSGRVAISDLEPGDCVNNIEEDRLVAKVDAVPCSQLHSAEVFAVFDLTGSSFPGDSTANDQAEQGCLDRLDDYAPDAVNDEGLDLFYFAPNANSWSRGDREVVCLALDSNKRTGSLRA